MEEKNVGKNIYNDKNIYNLWAADIHAPLDRPRISLDELYCNGCNHNDCHNDRAEANDRADVIGSDADVSSANSAHMKNEIVHILQEEPLVVLFGNEARGLPLELRNKTDGSIFLPIYGKAESFNLAASGAGILCTLSMVRHANYHQSLQHE